MQNAITIKDLKKTYDDGTEALKGVDLEIAQGDFFALLGANGAGKTTIIGILTGIVRKTLGQVSVFDHNIDKDLNSAKRCIGVVPQEFNFNMFEKVQDIVVVQAGYFGVPYHQAKKDSEDILKRVGLWEKRNSKSRDLSGGMKRRLMIARALIHKPKLLILDEPTAGVDVELRHGMWEYLRELNNSGTTILLTTHYLEEVEQMCRHCAIIKEGQIIINERVSKILQLLPEETYVITVKEMKEFKAVREFSPAIIDDHTIEVEISKDESLGELMRAFNTDGFAVKDLRPKGQRMEKLFLNILKS